MVMEYSLGLTEEGIKETIIMIKSMDLAFIPGPTEDSMLANGKMDNNMVKESTRM